jgi:hypothetical protein
MRDGGYRMRPQVLIAIASVVVGCADAPPGDPSIDTSYTLPGSLDAPSDGVGLIPDSEIGEFIAHDDLRRVREDWIAYREIGLHALAGAPDAFGGTLANEEARSVVYWI